MSGAAPQSSPTHKTASTSGERNSVFYARNSDPYPLPWRKFAHHWTEDETTDEPPETDPFFEQFDNPRFACRCASKSFHRKPQRRAMPDDTTYANYAPPEQEDAARQSEIPLNARHDHPNQQYNIAPAFYRRCCAVIGDPIEFHKHEKSTDSTLGDTSRVIFTDTKGNTVGQWLAALKSGDPVLISANRRYALRGVRLDLDVLPSTVKSTAGPRAADGMVRLVDWRCGDHETTAISGFVSVDLESCEARCLITPACYLCQRFDENYNYEMYNQNCMVGSRHDDDDRIGQSSFKIGAKPVFFNLGAYSFGHVCGVRNDQIVAAIHLTSDGILDLGTSGTSGARIPTSKTGTSGSSKARSTGTGVRGPAGYFTEDETREELRVGVGDRFYVLLGRRLQHRPDHRNRPVGEAGRRERERVLLHWDASPAPGPARRVGEERAAPVGGSLQRGQGSGAGAVRPAGARGRRAGGRRDHQIKLDAATPKGNVDSSKFPQLCVTAVEFEMCTTPSGEITPLAELGGHSLPLRQSSRSERWTRTTRSCRRTTRAGRTLPTSPRSPSRTRATARTPGPMYVPSVRGGAGV